MFCGIFDTKTDIDLWSIELDQWSTINIILIWDIFINLLRPSEAYVGPLVVPSVSQVLEDCYDEF